MKEELTIAVAIGAFGAHQGFFKGLINRCARTNAKYTKVVGLHFRLEMFEVSASATKGTTSLHRRCQVGTIRLQGQVRDGVTTTPRCLQGVNLNVNEQMHVYLASRLLRYRANFMSEAYHEIICVLPRGKGKAPRNG